jgi:hypothetical protein
MNALFVYTTTAIVFAVVVFVALRVVAINRRKRA